MVQREGEAGGGEALQHVLVWDVVGCGDLEDFTLGIDDVFVWQADGEERVPGLEFAKD